MDKLKQMKLNLV